jgi:ketosteroid isomerase-like protein
MSEKSAVRIDVEDLWMSDAVFDETKVGTGVSHGAAEIRKFFGETAFVAMSGMAHITASNIITGYHGDTARGVCSVIFEGDVKDGGTIRSTAYYDDVYTRTEEGWKFKSRTVVPFCKPDMDALLKRSAV